MQKEEEAKSYRQGDKLASYNAQNLIINQYWGPRMRFTGCDLWEITFHVPVLVLHSAILEMTQVPCNTGRAVMIATKFKKEATNDI